MGKSLFKELGITMEGKVLSYEEFRPFLGEESLSFRPEKMEPIIKEAEAALEAEIPMLPLSLYRKFFRDGNRSEFEAKHHGRRRMLLPLVLAEYYENQNRFTDKIVDLVWAICEESTWVIPAHIGSPGIPSHADDEAPNVDLYAANCSSLLAMTCYLLRDKLDAYSPNIYKKIKHLITVRAIRPYLERTCGWEKSAKPNNWLTDIYSHVLIATALLEEDQSVREAVVRKALGGLDHFVEGYPDDGCCDEGAAYWTGAAGSLFECLDILYDMSGGRIDAFKSDKVRAMGEYVALMHIDKKLFVNFSDCYPYIPCDGTLVRRYGERCGSELMERFGKYMYGFSGDFRHFTMIYRTVRGLLVKGVSSDVRPKPRLATYLPGHKVAVFREDGEGSRGFTLAAKGGCNGEAHNHNDVGNFVAYYDGQPVIIEAGMGTYCRDYFSPNRSKFWNVQSSYHTLPSFDGVMQSSGAAFASRDEVCDLDKKFFSMSLEGAYPEEAGLISYRRSLTLGQGEILVKEEFALDKEREIDLHFLLLNKPVILPDGKIDIGEGRVLSFDPDQLTPTMEEVIAPGMQPAMNIRNQWHVDSLWRVTLRTHAEKTTVEYSIR